MLKLKQIGYAEFARKLIRAGYLPIHKSKHTIYYNPRKQITIPLPHKHGRDVPKGLLNKIIKEMKINREEFNKL